VDDGSNDYTSELMEWYENRDSRIRYFQRPNNLLKGANSCRNYGFELSKGDFIQWLDSDDLLCESKIAAQVQLFNKYPTLDLSFCKWRAFQISKFDAFEEQN